MSKDRRLLRVRTRSGVVYPVAQFAGRAQLAGVGDVVTALGEVLAGGVAARQPPQRGALVVGVVIHVQIGILGEPRGDEIDERLERLALRVDPPVLAERYRSAVQAATQRRPPGRTTLAGRPRRGRNHPAASLVLTTDIADARRRLFVVGRRTNGKEVRRP